MNFGTLKAAPGGARRGRPGSTVLEMTYSSPFEVFSWFFESESVAPNQSESSDQVKQSLRMKVAYGKFNEALQE